MQPRWLSFVEAVTNIVVGYALAVLTQIIVFPLFGLHASLGENLLIGGLFTGLCGAPHKQVYVEHMIMRSLRRLSQAPQRC